MSRLEKYIEDKKFIKWAFQPDEETVDFFENYMIEHPDEKKYMLELKSELTSLALENKKYEAGTPEKIYQKVLVDIINTEKQNQWRIRLMQSLKVAAVALVLVVSGFLVYQMGFSARKNYTFSEELLLIGTMVEPKLYLTDGSTITVPGPDYFVDYSLKDKLVVGKDTIDIKSSGKRDNQYNLLVVAYGKRVKVSLPDKSEVWVNAGSRLISPQNFDKKKREVFLFGEGFFDVTHNENKPFYVQTTSMAVKVLGTEFNVSAYPEIGIIETVLKEGSVQIESKDSRWFAEKAVLEPNQKATFNKTTNTIVVEKVEQENYTRWKEGLITIDNDSLKGVISKLERHFNIDIEIVDPEKEKELISGKLDFSVDIERVFEYIEKLTNGKFEENGPGKYKFK